MDILRSTLGQKDLAVSQSLVVDQCLLSEVQGLALMRKKKMES